MEAVLPRDRGSPACPWAAQRTPYVLASPKLTKSPKLVAETSPVGARRPPAAEAEAGHVLVTSATPPSDWIGLAHTGWL